MSRRPFYNSLGLANSCCIALLTRKHDKKVNQDLILASVEACIAWRNLNRSFNRG